MRLKKIMLAGVSMLALAVASSEAMAASFGFTGAEDFYTIPVSGIYDVTAAGAQGGGNNPGSGGAGAIVHGKVFLSAGTILDIVVGGIGGTDGDDGGGGGGGTFVFLDSPFTRLAIGGGGGGAGFSGGPGGPGQAGTAGQNGNGAHGGAGGTGAYGGQGGAGEYGNGGGGTGFYTPGGDGQGSRSGYGGHYQYGGYGSSLGNYGGFGGGGGGGYNGGGGGGGYSGGGGGDGYAYFDGVSTQSYGGGGGGSYLAPVMTNTDQRSGANYGYGYVTIDPSSVPEPGTLPVLGSALLALGLWRRRRS